MSKGDRVKHRQLQGVGQTKMLSFAINPLESGIGKTPKIF